MIFTRPAHSRPKPNDQGQGHNTKAKASCNQGQRRNSCIAAVALVADRLQDHLQTMSYNTSRANIPAAAANLNTEISDTSIC